MDTNMDKVEKYLELEKKLDTVSFEEEDALMDELDYLWYSFSKEDLEKLRGKRENAK